MHQVEGLSILRLVRLVEERPQASEDGAGLLLLPEPVMGHGHEGQGRRGTLVGPIGFPQGIERPPVSAGTVQGHAEAEAILSLIGGQAAGVLGLGAALYRAGRYREAIETLEKTDRLDAGSPSAQAFLAMAHHQLGQKEQARAVLARLRALFDQPHRAKDAEAFDLMHEAEALIAPPRATTER